MIGTFGDVLLSEELDSALVFPVRDYQLTTVCPLPNTKCESAAWEAAEYLVSDYSAAELNLQHHQYFQHQSFRSINDGDSWIADYLDYLEQSITDEEVERVIAPLLAVINQEKSHSSGLAEIHD